MDIIYKRLTENELDTFIQMRINQLHEEGATEEIDLVPNLEDYYNRHMADRTYNKKYNGQSYFFASGSKMQI